VYINKNYSQYNYIIIIINTNIIFVLFIIFYISIMSNFYKFMKLETSTALESFSKNMTSYVNRDSLSVKCDCSTHNNGQGCKDSHKNNLQIVRPMRFGFRLKMNDHKNGFVVDNPELYHKSGQRLGAGYWRNTTCDCDIHDNATNEKVANMHFCLDDKGEVHNLQLKHEHDNDVHSHEYIDAPNVVTYNVTTSMQLKKAASMSQGNSSTAINLLGAGFTNDEKLQFYNTVLDVEAITYFTNGVSGELWFNYVNDPSFNGAANIIIATSFTNHGLISIVDYPTTKVGLIQIDFTGSFINKGKILCSDIKNNHVGISAAPALSHNPIINDSSGNITFKNIIGTGIYTYDVFNNLGSISFTGDISGNGMDLANDPRLGDTSTNSGTIDFSGVNGLGLVIWYQGFTNKSGGKITFNSDITNNGIELVNERNNFTNDGTLAYNGNIYGSGIYSDNSNNTIQNNGDITFKNIEKGGTGFNNLTIQNYSNIYFYSTINGVGILNTAKNSQNYNVIEFKGKIQRGALWHGKATGISVKYPIINTGTIKFTGEITNYGIGYSISTDVSSNYYNSNSGSLIFDCSFTTGAAVGGIGYGVKIPYQAFGGTETALYKACNPTTSNPFNLDSSCNFIDGGDQGEEHITFPGCVVVGDQYTSCTGLPFVYPL